MMAEIEIKILGIDADQVAARLEALGATFLFDGLVKCVHFDREGDAIRSANCLFRLRRWEGMAGFPSKFEICFKGPKTVVDGCKVREEIETTVEDADTFEAMMLAMGYHISMDNEKRRRSYEWQGAHVDIDEYPGVPAYMEIEGVDRVMIDRAVDALGLQTHERSTESAEELFVRVWPEVDFERLKF